MPSRIQYQLVLMLLLAIPFSAYSAEEPFHKLAALWGLEPIHSLELTGDDVEIRFWATSFGYNGFVLSRRQGRWQYFHLGENRDSMVSALHGYRAARVLPMCDPEQVLAELKSLGVDTLKPPRREPSCSDESDQPCLERIQIDGWSAFAEYKSADGLISQHYPIPGLPHFAGGQDDPLDYPSYRVELMYRLLQHVVGGREISLFKPHSQSFSLPAIVLSRPTYSSGVQAFLIHDYRSNEHGGALRYETVHFREYPQGFEVSIFEENDDRLVDISWRGYRRMLIGHGREAFQLQPDGSQWRALQDGESAANTQAHELSVSLKNRFEDLTYIDLTSGFEREFAEDSGNRACRRMTPLVPQTPPVAVASVYVESVTDNSEDKSRWWRVLPPELAPLQILTVRGQSAKHWIGVSDLARFKINQELIVKPIELPPPAGSDKPVMLLQPVDVY